MTAYERYQARKNLLIQSGKLTKSGIKELERPLNLAIEEKWKAVQQVLLEHGTDSPAAGDLYYSSYPSIKTLSKKPAWIKKFYKKYPNEKALIEKVEGRILEMVDQFQPDADEMNELYQKAEALKAQKDQEREQKQKADKNPEQFAPAPAMNTVRMVNDVIVENTEELKASIKSDIQKRMEGCVERFEEALRQGPITNLGKAFSKNSMEVAYLSTLVQRDSICPGPRDPIVLRPDYKARIDARATAEAKEIVENFRIKTIKKLSTACEGFGKLEQINMSVGSYRGAVEGTIGVKFEDGTSFDVRSQLVLAISPNGLLFSRYPTTFHNVQRPGEKLVKMMPEAEIARLGRTSKGAELAV